MVGSNVELRCVDSKENTFDLNELHVYWQITVSGKLKIVTYYLSGNSSAAYDDNQYKGRAHLLKDSMRHGDFSLHLYNVTPQDEQEFNCLVFKNWESVLNVVVTLHVAGKGVGMVADVTAASRPRGRGLTGGFRAQTQFFPRSVACQRCGILRNHV